VHYLSFVVLSAGGVQTLFNLNPLLRLDGYYLLSDWLEIPNLRQRAVDYVKAHLRAVLWGATRPAPDRRSTALLGYGVLSWTYSLFFVGLMLVGFAQFFGARWGIVGFAAVALLVIPTARGLLGGITAGELSTMIRKRHKRTAFWVLLVAAASATSFVNVEDRVGGTCSLRPTARCELRTPLAGFIAEVHVDEGDRVSPGQCAIRLSVPDLDSRIVQKQAEARESESKLNLLEAGARPEELTEQRQRVERALGWRDLADEDVQHARQALAAELERLQHASAKAQAQLDAARQRFQRADGLAPKRAMTKDDYEQVQLNMQIAELDGEQLRAARSALTANGTRDSEAELARREKDLADERGKLALMEAGTRPEEIDAERARLARLAEELHYLEGLQAKLFITSSVAGTVTTPRLKEKIGQYVREGDLIGLVEEPAALEAEIALDEQQIERLSDGLPVSIKSRAVPIETYWAKVDRMAPTAAKVMTLKRV
jgi:putative peptide zinc metalloprotease protein